jgi:hypothetical protein
MPIIRMPIIRRMLFVIFVKLVIFVINAILINVILRNVICKKNEAAGRGDLINDYFYVIPSSSDILCTSVNIRVLMKGISSFYLQTCLFLWISLFSLLLLTFHYFSLLLPSRVNPRDKAGI